MDEQTRTIGVLKSILKKKLEDKILESMDNPNELSNDFEDIEHIAREHNFQSVVLGIEEVDREIGRIQRMRVFERQKKREVRKEEKEFEEYLVSHPEVFEEIEPGLKYISHQKVVRSGRLDIVCQDKYGNNVKVELKARDESPRNYHFQLMKYFHDDKKGNERVLFLARSDDPGLNAITFSLASFQNQGRMRFFGVTKNNGNYLFSEVTPENIQDPKPIDWGKSSRKKQENGKIRVTSPAVRQPIRRDEEKTQEEVDWDKASTYERVLMIQNPGTNREEFLNNFLFASDLVHLKEITGKLKNLVWPNNFEEAIRVNEKDLKSFPKVSKKQGMPKIRVYSYQENEDIENGVKLMHEYYNIFCDLQRDFNSHISDISSNSDLVSKLESLRNCSDHLDDLFKKARYQDKTLKRFRRILTKKMESAEGSYKDVLTSYLGSSFFTYYGLLNEFFKLKIKRTEAFSDISRNIALFYLRFNPGVSSTIRIIGEIDKNFIKNSDSIDPFIKNGPVADQTQEGFRYFISIEQALYEEMLNLFNFYEVIPQESFFQSTAEIPNGVTNSSINEISPYQKLEHIFHLNGNRAFLSRDSKLRMEYFVHDLKNYGLGDDYVKAIGDSFAQFNLSKRLRKKENIPGEIALRTFFDDVTLNYVLKSKIPSPKDLENLYNQDCQPVAS